RGDLLVEKDVLEVLAHEGRALSLFRVRDGDRLAERAVDEALEPHLRAVADLGVADVEADLAVDPVVERVGEAGLERLLELLGLLLQAVEHFVARQPARNRRKDVELRARRAVDGDEVAGRENGAEEPAERASGVAEDLVE